MLKTSPCRLRNLTISVICAALLVTGCAYREKATKKVVFLPSTWEQVPGWYDDTMLDAWAAHQASCRVLLQEEKWKTACRHALAKDLQSAADIRRYFETYFRPQKLALAAQERGLLTGYYLPIIKGSRKRHGIYQTPLYAVPKKLGPGQTLPARKALLQSGLLRGKELVYIDNPIDAACIQVQGSGIVELAEGGRLYLNFAGSNQQSFRSIYRFLVQNKAIEAKDGNIWNAIKAWAKAHPKKVEFLLNQNPRVIFFEAVQADQFGLGALGVQLTAKRSIAVDRTAIMLGSPVFIASTWPGSTKPLRRLMFAQDIGAAILGTVRADFFWGIGPEAGELAVRTKQALEVWVLQPL